MSVLKYARKQILQDEQGTRMTHKRFACAFVYPSPYHIGMSSLGYQTLYRQINDYHQEWSAERAFLPDDTDEFKNSHQILSTLERGRPVNEFDAIGISVAYELELQGVIEVLQYAQLAPLANERRLQDPPVIIGGPLTFSNPLPVAPFADVIILGEAEDILPACLDLFSTHSKTRALEILSTYPHVLVPSIHGEVLPSVAACRNELLPAYSAILTPHTTLSNMFLIEPERGCHRNCTFCVMRRSTNGGMRLVSKERILELLPNMAKKVGLVGAAVSDHPKIVDILHALVKERGLQVGISSLRADRLNDEFVSLLAQGGYRTLTVASDAASQRLRDQIEKKIKDKHLIQAALLAKKHKLALMKIYMIIGLPNESDADIDELVTVVRELSTIIPVALGIAPFVPKYNTPLADAPRADLKVVESRLNLLKQGLKGRAEVRISSLKEAYVESVLAGGGFDVGLNFYASQLKQPGFKSFIKHIKQTVEPARRYQQFVDPYPAHKPLLKQIYSSSSAC